MRWPDSPMSGSFSEVGGMLSPITMRKTVMERRVVMPRVTWGREALHMRLRQLFV